MSLSEVQARAAELQMRLRQLSGPSALRGGASGPLGLAGAQPSFADALSSAGAASPTAAASSARSASGGTTGEDVVATAKKQLGQDYVWGGESRAEGGFDCSGLIQWAYKEHGIDLPRVSRDQAKAGREVSAAEARPGDLVYFERPHPRPDHIGMYAGNGQWVVAPKTGDVVKMQDVDLSKATTIRRVLPDGPAAPTTGTAALRGSGVEASSRGSVLGPGLPAAGQRYAGQIEKAATAAGISPHLLAAVAWSESGFDPSARSSAGAVGLVQLMPRTAAGLGVTDPTDPAQSLKGGATYLRQQLDAFNGRTDLALAAYNAGPTAVRKHGGIPPYRETQNYVDRVLTRVRTLGGTP